MAFNGALAGILVSGIAQDSALVRPGNLFAALPGERVHGAEYAAEALAAGARAIITDPEGAALLENQGIGSVLVLSRLREALPHIARQLFPLPAKSIPPKLFAVTGTNGKTSTLHLAIALLEKLGARTAISTTVERRTREQVHCSSLTTPETCELYAHLAAAAEAEVEYFGVEVSSHALTRRRIAGLHFQAVGFTNLTSEHMEEHRDMESYYAAKSMLFTEEYGEEAVINVDTRWGRRLAQETTLPHITLSSSYGADLPPASADWEAEVNCAGAFGSQLLLRARTAPDRLRAADNGQLRLRLDLMGKIFGVNAALAVLLVMRLGFPLSAIEVALGDSALSPRLPARMERFSRPGSPLVVVDHGHTIDAVEKAVSAARSLTPGVLVTIINADGERDHTKRASLGRICAQHSDRLIVTDGHSRFENPENIRNMIISGVEREDQKNRVLQIPNMLEAVRTALSLAGSQGTVLCAGFGDDPYLDVRGHKTPFSLRDEVNRILDEVYGVKC